MTHVTSPTARRTLGGPACRPGVPAFTLIELLIVIAVLALLMSLLVPMLNRAKLLAERAVCMANLKGLGSAAALYAEDYAQHVPICWANLDPGACVNPWPSWRSNLLPYAQGYRMFNCPSAEPAETGFGAVFRSDEDILSQENSGTANAGSYGVMFQYSYGDYMTLNSDGDVTWGHPMWSLAFPIRAGTAWRSPAESVYVADGCLTKGPVTYPSRPWPNYGTSVITPPGATYFGVSFTRRFADRHEGTNCLFVGGSVVGYVTEDLDQMESGEANCVWDVE